MLMITQYGTLKRVEHMWKGFGGHESQISPIPPERYGERFIRFISGITMSREQAEKVRLSHTLQSTVGVDLSEMLGPLVNDSQLGGINIHDAQLDNDPRNPAGTDKVMERAQHEADKTKRLGADEDDVPNRSLGTVRDARGSGDHNEAATLPVIGEAQETASNTSHTPSKEPSRENLHSEPIIGDANVAAEQLGQVPPPTPPKDSVLGSTKRTSLDRATWTSLAGRESKADSSGPPPPPTPPKDNVRSRGRTFEKDLPLPPPSANYVFSASPARMAEEELEKARAKVSGAA
jgi:1-phosphatidylinositol-4-phosphate 5-kinase